MAIHFANTELSDAIGETWRITSNFTGDASPVTNWERADQTGGGSNYNVVNESSGIFTFNQTGWYHCNWWMYIYNPGQTASYWNEMQLHLSWNNGSNWKGYQYAQGHLPGSAVHYTTNHAASTFSIPAISGSGTRKIKFTINQNANSNVTTAGASDYSWTGFTIVKIADQ
tara:strand:- start:196 stop:705 length:510 start_codon:yes stop_codon:yes gene_type:complete